MGGDENLREVIKEILEEHTRQNHALIERVMLEHINSSSHRFVEKLIQREARRQEMWDKAKGNALSYGIITLIIFLGVAIWQYVKVLLGKG